MWLMMLIVRNKWQLCGQESILRDMKELVRTVPKDESKEIS